MALTINTNVSALTAQRYLGINANNSASSLAKLSSGSRVPAAKDDAAGLAVGSQLRAEVSALKQAAQNANQAVSLLQIADGALSTISDILIRAKSLATQSSSGQLSDASRALLDQEFESLKSEITRISSDTDFNGRKLLNGGDVLSTFTESKSGGLDGQGISISFDTGETGADEVFRVDYDYTNAAQDIGNLTVTNLTTGEAQTIDITSVIQGQTTETSTDLTTNLGAGQTAAINFAALGVTLTLDDRFDVDADFNQTVSIDASSTAQAEVTGKIAVTFLDGGDVSGAQFAALTTLSTDGFLSITANDGTNDALTLSGTGLEFSVDGINYGANTGAIAADGTLLATETRVFIRTAGATNPIIQLDLTNTMDVVGANGSGTSTLELDLNGLVRAEETTSTTAQFNFRVGTGAVTAEDELSVSITAVSLAALGIAATDIGDSEANAELALAAIDTAISTVSGRRTDIGASQSRLEFATASINVAIENTTAAQSAILDVDVSAEITEFTSKQVLLQAGISLLAQANQQPSLLLSLLQ